MTKPRPTLDDKVTIYCDGSVLGPFKIKAITTLAYGIERNEKIVWIPKSKAKVVRSVKLDDFNTDWRLLIPGWMIVKFKEK